MCGNNDSIEKHLFCRGGQNHEGFAEITNIAMMEFAAHFNYPFRISGDGVHVGRKSKAAISFQDSCKYFAGVFISGPARITYVRRRPVGEEPFQILLRFMESAQKSFQTQIRKPNPARPSYFFRNLPLFPAISRFRIFSNVNGERERMFCAVRVTGRGQRMGNIGKSFVKVLTFLGKYVFWGIIEIEQRSYNDKCISQFFALLPRAFSGVWAFRKSLCRISIFYFFYMRRFCPNVFGLLFYSYLGK